MPFPGGSVSVADSPVLDTDRLASAVNWIFRIALAMEFLGHGAFGVAGGREAWVPYFGVVGIGSRLAWTLMPLVGYVDVTLAVLILLRPMRATVLYMAVWGLWTALLRPLAGESWWEFLDRGGNYGVALAYFAWSGVPRMASAWFEPISAGGALQGSVRRAARILYGTIVLFLVGHAGITAVLNKPVLATQWASFGIHAVGPIPILPAEGWLDGMLAAMMLLFQPTMWTLGFVALWKVACELLWPLSGAPFWEFVERGGSYAAPLLLLAIATLTRLAPSEEISSCDPSVGS